MTRDKLGRFVKGFKHTKESKRKISNGLGGSKHPNWKGGRKSFCLSKNKKRFEKILGRKLESNECIHHKDGNWKNNKLENLQLMTLSEHSKLHSKDRIFSEETRKKISENVQIWWNERKRVN